MDGRVTDVKTDEPVIGSGDVFEDAFRIVFATTCCWEHRQDISIVHGFLTDSANGERYVSAWVERSNSAARIGTSEGKTVLVVARLSEYRRVAQCAGTTRYSWIEALDNLVKYNSCGPWRRSYLTALEKHSKERQGQGVEYAAPIELPVRLLQSPRLREKPLAELLLADEDFVMMAEFERNGTRRAHEMAKAYDALRRPVPTAVGDA